MNAVASIEQHRLTKLEATIRTSRLSFLATGQALAEIQAGLYMAAGFGTFEAYVESRWDMRRAQAYRLIIAAVVYENCLQLETTAPPENEAQCRELARLDTPELQREAWQKATDTAPNGKITAKHVAAVVKSMFPVDSAPATTNETEYDEYLSWTARPLRSLAEISERCSRSQLEQLLRDLQNHAGRVEALLREQQS